MSIPSIRDNARTLAAGLADLLWPRFCLVCDHRIDALAPTGGICETCRDVLTADRAETCPRCACSIGSFVDTTGGCLRCRTATFRFDRAVRLGPYDGLVRDAVLRMKHDSGEMLAEELGRLLAAKRNEELRYTAPDLVVPVPLHWRKRWARGYNQSTALARGAAGTLGIPCQPDVIVRTCATPTQVGRAPSARWANVRGVFRVRSSAAIRGLRVLLVDDVLTTGATVSSAAGALCDAGVAQVVVAVVAHG